ncbi:MAG TPA: hypothetical protein V6C65_13880, partial [Allocoleopsis sp.]
KIKTDAVLFGNAVDPSSVPNNALILDQNSGNISTKQSGSSSSVSGGGIPTKTMVSDEAIPINTAIAKKSNGKIVKADADDPARQNIIGVTAVAFASPDITGEVNPVGPSVAGILTGLGFAPGDEIYAGTTPGTFTNDPTTINTDTGSIIFMGYADCASGVASNVATDLIMVMEIVSRPAV